MLNLAEHRGLEPFSHYSSTFVLFLLSGKQEGPVTMVPSSRVTSYIISWNWVGFPKSSETSGLSKPEGLVTTRPSGNVTENIMSFGNSWLTT